MPHNRQKQKKCKEIRCKYIKICSNRNPYINNLMCKGYEEYANQDEVPQKEPPLSMLGCDKSQIPYTENPLFLSPPKKEFLIAYLFFVKQIKISDITREVYCSRNHAYRIINRVKRLRNPKKRHI